VIFHKDSLLGLAYFRIALHLSISANIDKIHIFVKEYIGFERKTGEEF
jgi:hypothetical protein